MADWKLEGKYFESCTCDLVCPCIFLMPPTKGFCEAFVCWDIAKGHKDGTDLSGLKVAAWLHAPGLLTDGGWKLALYIDKNADESQKTALTEIYGGNAGGHPAVIAGFVGEIMGVHSAGIEIKMDPKRKELKIEGVGGIKMDAIEGEDGGDVTVKNHPLAVAPGYPLIVHKSEKLEYSDHGQQWEQSGTVGLAAQFSYQP